MAGGIIESEQMALADGFRAAMRRTAAGVAIITTHGASGPAGITVSSFGSVSMTPPSVLACIARESRTLAAVLESGFFAASVLADEHSPLAEAFSRPVPDHADRFALGHWRSGQTGCLMLDDAVASFDCQLAKTFDYGSHTIIIGDVRTVIVGGAAPLVYADRNFHRLPPA